MRLARRDLLAALPLPLVLPQAARAQGSRAVTLVVPYAAGGGTDIAGREFALGFGPAVGETVVVEYEFRVESSYFTDNFYRGFSVPIGEYLLQIQFDAQAVPAKCYSFERHSVSAPDQGVREVWIGSTQGAHLLACEVPPGVVGMRWEWE